MPPGAELTPQEFADVQTLWDFHHVHHELRPTDVGIGLGSHDIGVATHTAELYHQGMFPLIVFTGANAPTTIDRFPRGEAVHYREHALSLGVPDDAILVEANARNTVDNITHARDLLIARGIDVDSASLVSRPYQQRRAYNIARRLWPRVDTICTAQEITLPAYLHQIGDIDRVVNTVVADTQRLVLDHSSRNAVAQPLPDHVISAYDRLTRAGFTRRVICDSALST